MAEFTKKIKITADTTAAQSAIARLELQMKGFSETMEAFSGHFEGVSRATENLMGKLEKLGLASLFAEGGAIGLANKIADMGYELGETATKTGLTVAQLQYWQYAAKQSGLDADTLTSAITRLTVNIGMANKPTSEQAQAFRFLGISAKFLHDHANDTNGLFIEVMKRLGGVHDQTKRNTASMILFSRAFRELLPLMKSISSGSKENIEDFQKYGLVMNEDAIKQSEQFHRASINLQTALGGLSEQIGMELIPVILPLVKNMADYVAQNRKLIATNISTFITQISQAFRDAWITALPFLRVLHSIVEKMGGLKTVILLVAGYIAADLAVSFGMLAFQIGIATIAMARFLALGSVGAIRTLIGLVGLLRNSFLSLNLVMMLNPVVAAIAGITAAVTLLIVALKKLAELGKSIKSSFESHTGIYSSAFWERHLGRNSAMQTQASQFPAIFNTTNQLQAASPLQAAMPIVPRITSSTQNKQQTHLNVHLKIDADGRPSIASVQSSDPLTFTSSLGILR